ncbi:MAG: hypothetical protein ABIQ95_05010 [Bdellovibrionia bacterium]
MLILFFIAPASNAQVAEERAVISSDPSLTSEEMPSLQKFNLSFLAIFYGPSLKDPSRSQPNLSGDPDPDRPVNLRNFINLGYNLSDRLAITGTVYGTLQPFLQQKLVIQDPFIRVSDNSLFNSGPFNLYADFRVYFGVSSVSRQSDQYFGIQTVEVATFAIPDSHFSLGTYGAVRSNVFGKHGYGYDLELYLGPHINYQVSPTVLATLLYEMRGAHVFGAKFGNMINDGTDLQPGLTWDVTPQLMLNPYLNVQTGGRVNLKTTTFGLLANWNLF